MKISITGGTGLLGSSLIGHLLKAGKYEISALSRTPHHSGEIRWIAGDLTNPADCMALVKDADVVIHMAYDGSPLASGGDLVREARNNLLPTLTLLQAVRDTGKKPRFLFPSSGGAVYGVKPQPHLFREMDPCLPLNSYGVLKLAIEEYLRLAAYRAELSAIVLRVSNAYGKPLPPERSQGLIGTTISRLAAGMPVRIIGDPKNVRDYVHVDDVSIAFERAIRHKSDFAVFNVGAGVGHTVDEVIAIIERAHGKTIPREYVDHPNAAWLPSSCVLNVARAASELDWTPTIELDRGVRGMLEELPVARRS